MSLFYPDTQTEWRKKKDTHQLKQTEEIYTQNISSQRPKNDGLLSTITQIKMDDAK